MIRVVVEDLYLLIHLDRDIDSDLAKRKNIHKIYSVSVSSSMSIDVI